MILIRVLGKPDLFVTMTCNPNWSKIIDELEPSQSPHNCLDAIVHVFEFKLKAMMDEIIE